MIIKILLSRKNIIFYYAETISSKMNAKACRLHLLYMHVICHLIFWIENMEINNVPIVTGAGLLKK